MGTKGAPTCSEMIQPYFCCIAAEQMSLYVEAMKGSTHRQLLHTIGLPPYSQTGATYEPIGPVRAMYNCATAVNEPVPQSLLNHRDLVVDFKYNTLTPDEIFNTVAAAKVVNVFFKNNHCPAPDAQISDSDKTLLNNIDSPTNMIEPTPDKLRDFLAAGLVTRRDDVP